MLDRNNWNHLIIETIETLVCKHISSNLFKNQITYKLFTKNHVRKSSYLNECKQNSDVKLLLLHTNA